MGVFMKSSWLLIALVGLLALSIFGFAFSKSTENTAANELKIKIFHGALGGEVSRQEFENTINKWLSENESKILPSNVQQSNLGKFSTQTNLIYRVTQNGPKIRAKVFTGCPSENEDFSDLEKRISDWLNENKPARFLVTQSSSDNNRIDMIVWYEVKN